MERMIRYSGFRWGISGVNGRIFECFFMVILALLLMISCAGAQVQKSQAKGIYHIVKKGETAYGIARAYSISLRDLAEINNISDVSTIKEGAVIFIPNAKQVIDDVMSYERKAGADETRNTGMTNTKLPDRTKPAKSTDMPQAKEKTPLEKPDSAEHIGAGAIVAPPSSVTEQDEPKIEENPPGTEKNDELYLDKSKLLWPVRGTVRTRFGIQPNKTYHNWIKISCTMGVPVRATARGTVIFSASLKDFGETVILRHSNNFASVYTHLKKRYVKTDQNIKKGDIIALAGEIDETGETYINFEIRHKGKARNPLLYLP